MSFVIANKFPLAPEQIISIEDRLISSTLVTYTVSNEYIPNRTPTHLFLLSGEQPQTSKDATPSSKCSQRQQVNEDTTSSISFAAPGTDCPAPPFMHLPPSLTLRTGSTLEMWGEDQAASALNSKELYKE